MKKSAKIASTVTINVNGQVKQTFPTKLTQTQPTVFRFSMIEKPNVNAKKRVTQRQRRNRVKREKINVYKANIRIQKLNTIKTT